MEKIKTQILFVKNLPCSTDRQLLIDLFSPYGSIQQIRIGNSKDTLGTALVVYTNVDCAVNALKHMNGYFLEEKYLCVAYWQPMDKFVYYQSMRD